MSKEAAASIKEVDPRLKQNTDILGVEFAKSQRAYPLPTEEPRACLSDEVDGEPIAVFWYGHTKTAVAFKRTLNGRTLTFYADDIAPESAPFMDKETGTRWTIAGRGIDGPLRGQELTWAKSIQCRWYAWANEYPDTSVFSSKAEK